ncbi:hypothetical protein C2G38_2178799 [Gigaspora rosea]|uniref:Uncharacterized protein n=1 Tax=Gigaspora rosea TaxID=44941 RepID=A0A397VDU9_9GLOM|nr:hypothetical protein C2G38_2178799 [Gigaspora rosea]
MYVKPIPEEITALQRKSVFENYHKDTKLLSKLFDISNPNQFKKELCKYFTVYRKTNGNKYSVTFLQFAINALNQYFNGETSKIKLIDLNDKKAHSDFWHTLNRKIRPLSASGYEKTNESDALTINKLKTNQRSLESPSIAKTFSILPIFDIVESYNKYMAKRPPDFNSQFYLYPIRAASLIT